MTKINNKAFKQILKLTENNKTIPIDHFMSIALSYYYSNAEVFGKHGDFITSPEISQMFGETVGVWCALVFQKFNFTKFSIVEIGPGRGLLMSDILRSLKHFQAFNNALDKIYLIEISPKLIEIQKKNISDSKVHWLTHVDKLPPGNFIVVANEFFDALPIRQFKKTLFGWNEIVIGQKAGEIEFKENVSLEQFLMPVPIGGILEWAKEAKTYAALIASKIQKGAFLTFDYGYLESDFISTLQAVKSHKYADVLKDIGDSDITSHVDFSALKKVFNDANFTTQITTQRDFLASYGLLIRAQKLIENGANLTSINEQIERLTSNDQMGNLFKVLQAVKE